MQFAVRLAATLLALTWITSIAQAATVLRNFTLIGGTDQCKVQPEMARVYTGDLPLRMPAEISKPLIDQAHEHKLRAIAHIFYLDNASFTYIASVIAYLKQQTGSKKGPSSIIKSNFIDRGNNVEQSPY